MSAELAVAYFSMEIGIDPRVPTYCGGLGILAGDMLRSCADRGLAAAGVTLLHRGGYFEQQLDDAGRQREQPATWNPQESLHPVEPRVEVEIGGRAVKLGAWRYRLLGIDGHEVPIYFLDAAIPDNAPEDRALTGTLYGGDDRYRLAQETLLGVGGVRMLRALGYAQIRRFHLNEGHAALVVTELLREGLGDRRAWRRTRRAALRRVRAQCVFTTHTPVAAGHDVFAKPVVDRVLGRGSSRRLLRSMHSSELRMTDLALSGAGFVNAVSVKHGEVARRLLPGHSIHAIRNGVHAVTWTAKPLQDLFDRWLSGWRRDARRLLQVESIPESELERAHASAKRELLERTRQSAGSVLDRNVLTLGFARRATAYKRAGLIFHDLQALRGLVERQGPLQLVFSGKAHPGDRQGKRIIEEIFRARDALAGELPVVYLSEYGIETARAICAGVDVWLNTPRPPLEASGTSGMKAALNGVPSLSVLDGWWIEGCEEGITGWAIEPTCPDGAIEDDALWARALYQKLEESVLPCFYRDPEAFTRVRGQAIAQNGFRFSSQRMVEEYVERAYEL